MLFNISTTQMTITYWKAISNINTRWLKSNYATLRECVPELIRRLTPKTTRRRYRCRLETKNGWRSFSFPSSWNLPVMLLSFHWHFCQSFPKTITHTHTHGERERERAGVVQRTSEGVGCSQQMASYKKSYIQMRLLCRSTV